MWEHIRGKKEFTSNLIERWDAYLKTCDIQDIRLKKNMADKDSMLFDSLFPIICEEN